MNEKPNLKRISLKAPLETRFCFSGQRVIPSFWEYSTVTKTMLLKSKRATMNNAISQLRLENFYERFHVKNGVCTTIL